MNATAPAPFIVTLLAVAASVTLAQAPPDIERLTVSPVSRVTELDMGKLKGEPRQLAWSADGKQFYLQTVENAGRPNMKARHYLLGADSSAPQNVDAQPEWASAYWVDKSAQTSPDDRTFKIEAKSEQRTERTTSAPMGGEMARGGTSGDPTSGTSSGDAMAAAYGAQGTTVNVMVLKGERIGEFVNSVLVPGLTFGWGPKGTKLIAFAAPKTGRVMLMDNQGRKKEVAESRDAILPAWSQDGARLAWLQKEGRRKFSLQVANVSTGS